MFRYRLFAEPSFEPYMACQELDPILDFLYPKYREYRGWKERLTRAEVKAILNIEGQVVVIFDAPGRQMTWTIEREEL